MSEYFEYQGRRFFPEQPRLWRVPHDTERVNVDAGDFRYRLNVGMTGRGVVRREIRDAGVARPEIFRVYPDHTTPIGEAHQWLWRNLNIGLSAKKHCTLYGNKLAWTNGTGFPGRRNYVLREDMTEQLPTFDAARVNGGQIMEGEESNGRVYLRSLVISDPVPSALDAIADRLFGYGVSINPQGEVHLILRPGLDGINIPVKILFLTRYAVWLPVDELHSLTPGQPLPDPIWISS
jgi:hypothetical protein